MLLLCCAREWLSVHFLRTTLDQVGEHCAATFSLKPKASKVIFCIHGQHMEGHSDHHCLRPCLSTELSHVQVPEASMKATEVPFDNGETSFVRRSDTMPMLRRRLQLN